MPLAAPEDAGAALLDLTTVAMVVGLTEDAAALVEVTGALATTLEEEVTLATLVVTGAALEETTGAALEETTGAALEEATALEAGLDEAALELAGAAPEPDPLTVKSMQDS